MQRRLKQKINDFVFGYADSGKGHVVCPPQYHIKLVRAECGEHWSMHDLRRTFTTAMTLLNVHAFTIAHLMKYSMNSSMTLSYAPPAQEQLMEALVRFKAHLLARVRPADSQMNSRNLPGGEIIDADRGQPVTAVHPRLDHDAIGPQSSRPTSVHLEVMATTVE